VVLRRSSRKGLRVTDQCAVVRIPSHQHPLTAATRPIRRLCALRQRRAAGGGPSASQSAVSIGSWRAEVVIDTDPR